MQHMSNSLLRPVRYVPTSVEPKHLRSAVMRAMAEVEDEPDWGLRLKDIGADEDDLCYFGEQFLDRLGHRLRW